MSTPRGLALNNPGNIRHSSDHWYGMSADQPDTDFVKFQAPLWGIRAMAKILDHYVETGAKTVRDVISRWAPPTENDTENYIQFVASAVPCHADDTIDIVKCLYLIVPAMIKMEQGQQPYTAQVIQQAIAAAGGL